MRKVTKRDEAFVMFLNRVEAAVSSHLQNVTSGSRVVCTEDSANFLFLLGSLRLDSLHFVGVQNLMVAHLVGPLCWFRDPARFLQLLVNHTIW